MEFLVVRGHRRWFALVGVLAVALAVMLPLTVFADHPSEANVQVKAKDADGAELKAKVSGDDFASLAGRARIEDADGNKTKLTIDQSSIANSVITLEDTTAPTTGKVEIDLGASPPEVRVETPTGTLVATFTLGTDKLDLKIKLKSNAVEEEDDDEEGED